MIRYGGLLFIFLLVLSQPILTQSADASAGHSELREGFGKLAAESDGRIGICSLNVSEAAPVCVNGEQNFSLQSVMKLIAAAAVMEAIDRKQTRLSDVVVVRPEDASPGPQEFADLVRTKGALSTTVEDLIQRAVNDSDSTAIDVLIERLGGVKVVQDFLRRKQVEGIRIDRVERHLQAESMGLRWNARFADSKKFDAAVRALSTEKRNAAWAAYLKDPRDTATPAGMVRFLKALATGTLLSPASTGHLLAVMEKTQTGRDRLMSGIPKDWRIGHKTGTSPSWNGMTAATNDVGLLTSPGGGKVAIAVFVAESKRPNPERASVIAKAAAIVTSAYRGNKN
jgi:beta-lactamase class A